MAAMVAAQRQTILLHFSRPRLRHWPWHVFVRGGRQCVGPQSSSRADVHRPRSSPSSPLVQRAAQAKCGWPHGDRRPWHCASAWSPHLRVRDWRNCFPHQGLCHHRLHPVWSPPRCSQAAGPALEFARQRRFVAPRRCRRASRPAGTATPRFRRHLPRCPYAGGIASWEGRARLAAPHPAPGFASASRGVRPQLQFHRRRHHRRVAQACDGEPRDHPGHRHHRGAVPLHDPAVELREEDGERGRGAPDPRYSRRVHHY